MSIAEIKETKSNLIAWIEELSDEHTLFMLESIKNSQTDDDWWDALTPAQIDNINEGLKQAESGNVMSSSEFWTRLKDA